MLFCAFCSAKKDVIKPSVGRSKLNFQKLPKNSLPLSCYADKNALAYSYTNTKQIFRSYSRNMETERNLMYININNREFGPYEYRSDKANEKLSFYAEENRFAFTEQKNRKFYIFSNQKRHGPFLNAHNSGFSNGVWCYSVSSSTDFGPHYVIQNDRIFGPYNGKPQCYGEKWVVPRMPKPGYFLLKKTPEGIKQSGPYAQYREISHQNGAFMLDNFIFLNGKEGSISGSTTEPVLHFPEYGNARAIQIGKHVMLDTGEIIEFPGIVKDFKFSYWGNNWGGITCKQNNTQCELTAKNGQKIEIADFEEISGLTVGELSMFSYLVKDEAEKINLKRDLGDFIAPLLLLPISPIWLWTGIPDHTLFGKRIEEDNAGRRRVHQIGNSAHKGNIEDLPRSPHRNKPQKKFEGNTFRNCHFFLDHLSEWMIAYGKTD